MDFACPFVFLVIRVVVFLWLTRFAVFVAICPTVVFDEARKPFSFATTRLLATLMIITAWFWREFLANPTRTIWVVFCVIVIDPAWFARPFVPAIGPVFVFQVTLFFGVFATF